MISIGDGVAIAGVCGVLIAAIAKWTKQPTINGYLRATTFNAVHDGLKIQLADLNGDVKTIFKEIKDINNYMRGVQ